MGHDAQWEDVAHPARWLGPDEIIRWRGEPNPNVIFAPQDVFLVPISIIWCGFAIFWEHASLTRGFSFGNLYGAVFAGLGLYVAVGRFFMKKWTRRTLKYAVTNQRIVEVAKGEVTHSTSLTSTFEIRRSRDRRIGSILWDPDPFSTTKNGRVGIFDMFNSNSAMFEGTGWPLSEKIRSSVAFFDIDDVEQVLLAAGRTEPSAESNSGPYGSSRSSGAIAQPARKRFGRAVVCSWFRSRFTSRVYEIHSPLDFDEATSRLAGTLKSRKLFGGSDANQARGFVGGSQLVLYGRLSGNNSWNQEFNGVIEIEGSGVRIRGKVGPSGMWLPFAILWCSPLIIVLVVMISTFLYHVITLDLSVGFLRSVPFVLIPIVFLSAFAFITELGTRDALRGWEITDRWLRTLLEATDEPPAH